jgi:hypothetical protein
MIERTHRRLRQARFFYERLVNPRHSTKGDPETFRYYFSAFILSARTVTWTLKKEETKKWKAWEPKWAANQTKEEEKLLKITRDLRNIEEKEGGATLTVDFEEVAIDALVEAIPRDSRHTAFIHAQRRRLPGASTQKTVRAVLPVHYLENDKGKEVVTDLCRRYLDFLEKMVKDFCADMGLNASND